MPRFTSTSGQSIARFPAFSTSRIDTTSRKHGLGLLASCLRAVDQNIAVIIESTPREPALMH